MDFKNVEQVSTQLKTAIDAFTERMDMDRRDREFFYDIVGFAFTEGRIRGKEDILLGENTKTENDING